MITWKSPHVFLSGSLKWNPPTLKKKQTTKSLHVQYTKVQKKSHNSPSFFQPSPINLPGIYCNIPRKKHQQPSSPFNPPNRTCSKRITCCLRCSCDFEPVPSTSPTTDSTVRWPLMTSYPQTRPDHMAKHKKEIEKIGCTSSVKKKF